MATTTPFKRSHAQLYAEEELDDSEVSEADDGDERPCKVARERSSLSGSPRIVSNTSPSVIVEPASPSPPSAPCKRLPGDIWNLIFEYLCPDELLAVRFIKQFATLSAVLQIAKPNVPRVALTAARRGYFTQLMWLHSALHMPFSPALCTSAASAGRLDVLKWADALGCGWDGEVNIAAAGNGFLKILKWASTRGVTPTRDCVAAAAEGGFIEVLQWLASVGCPLWVNAIWDAEVINRAAKGGHQHVIEWAREQGCPWDRWTAVFAAEKGHINLLKWLHAHGAPITSPVCTAAADMGHLNILEWTTEIGCAWTAPSLQHLKNLNVLKWAAAHGLELTDQICTAAARNGHLDVLIWARANRCPWREADVLMQAAIYGRLEVLEWALGEGGATYFPQVATAAARNNHLAVLHWLAEYDLPMNERAVAKAAHKTQNDDMIAWVKEAFGEQVYNEAVADD